MSGAASQTMKTRPVFDAAIFAVRQAKPTTRFRRLQKSANFPRNSGKKHLAPEASESDSSLAAAKGENRGVKNR